MATKRSEPNPVSHCQVGGNVFNPSVCLFFLGEPAVPGCIERLSESMALLSSFENVD